MHLRFCLLSLLFAVAAYADGLTKNVQSALKDQGFYYGEISGVNGPETAAAVKRYQIRNGLEVTGTLTKETLEAMGLANEGAPAPTAPTPAPATKPRPAAPVERENRPPANLRRDNSAQSSDKDYLRRQGSAPQNDEPDPQPPAGVGPGGGPVGTGPYAHFFAHTPFAAAPLEVQQGTIKQAERLLRDLGMYHESIDGRPSPELEEALLSYQRFIRLPLTGQFDMETLAAMRLLPGRGSFPTRPANPAIRVIPGKPLRGVWIQ